MPMRPGGQCDQCRCPWGPYLKRSPARAGCGRGSCRGGCRGPGPARRPSCTLCPCPCGSGGALKSLRSVAAARRSATFPNAAGPLPVQTQAPVVTYNHHLTTRMCDGGGTTDTEEGSKHQHLVISKSLIPFLWSLLWAAPCSSGSLSPPLLLLQLWLLLPVPGTAT